MNVVSFDAKQVIDKHRDNSEYNSVWSDTKCKSSVVFFSTQ